MSRHDKDSLVTIRPLTDEGDDFGGRGQAATKPARGRANASKVANWPLRMMMIVLIAALAALAVWTVELQKQLQGAQGQLAQNQQFIQDLEKRLSVTDESVDQTSSLTEDKLSTLDKEIRKLWDNVWKRSKEQLAAHDKSIVNLEAEQKKASTRDNTLNSGLTALKTEVGGLSLRINVLDEQVAAASGVASELAALRTQVAELKKQQATATSKLASMSEDQTLIARRVKELDEWIKIINEDRKRVNAKLVQLGQP